MTIRRSTRTNDRRAAQGSRGGRPVVLPVTRPALAALVMALAPATATAADCAVVFADAPRAALADLPTDPGEGLFRCPGFEAPLVHWTIEVDPDRRSLGLRDRPLIGPAVQKSVDDAGRQPARRTATDYRYMFYPIRHASCLYADPTSVGAAY